MSSKDTQQVADHERQQAHYFREQIQRIQAEADQEIRNLQTKAERHESEADRLMDQAQNEMRQEADQRAQEERKAQKKNDDRRGLLGF